MLLILLGRDRGPRAENRRGASEWSAVRHRRSVAAAVGAQAAGVGRGAAAEGVGRAVHPVIVRQNFARFRLIDADLCKKIRVLQQFSKSTTLSSCNF